MKIKTINVKNFKAVKSASLDLNGSSVIVTAGNNKGKSSLLSGLQQRIRGIKPSIIVSEGEKDGVVSMVLTTGEKFVWEFSEEQERLLFYPKDGYGHQKLTKEITDRLFPKLFDVDDFLGMSPKEQTKALQDLVGIDFSELDLKIQVAYNERTFANRALKEAQTLHEKANVVKGYPDEEHDVSELQKASNELQKKRLEVERTKSTIESHKSKVLVYESREEDLKEQIKNLQRDLETVKKEKEAERSLLLAEIDKWTLLDEAGLDILISSNQERFNQAIEENKIIVENKKALVLVDKLNEALEVAKKWDKEYKDLTAKKDAQIKNASLPEGFEFGENGILFDGLPLDKKQLSTSKMYIAALKLATFTLGEVKSIHFDASPLDKNSLEDIQVWAEGEGLQLLIEMPDFEGGEICYQVIN